MRIDAAQRSGLHGQAGRSRALGGGGFTLSAAPGSAQGSSAAAAARPLADIASLLALQELGHIEDAGDRRRRMLGRGRRLLDALDELRVGLLGGTLAEGALARLGSAAGEAREATGEPGLDSVLDAVDLRAQVELAKLAVAHRR